MKSRSGVHRGLVVDSRDPQALGRVRVSLPSLDEEPWASVATLAAGNGTGSWFVPQTGDEVLVAFEGGDPDQPLVLGSLWSADQRPPETDPARVVLRTPHGATVVFDDGAGALEVHDANGNSVRLTPTGMTVTAAAKVTVSASELELDAGVVEVNAGAARFSGVVECETLIATNVVAQSYTPGAGNVL